MSFCLFRLVFMIQYMGKKVKNCPKECSNHAFLLKPVHYSAVFSREIAASYCNNSNNTSISTPKFNSDRHHFTPAFSLPADSKNMIADEDFYLKEQKRCMVSSQTSDILVAKPRGNDGYCSVCQQDYDDYLQHINEQSHLKPLRESKFNAYIQDLAAQINKQKEQLPQTRIQRLFSESILYYNQSTCFEMQDFLQHEEGNRIQQLFHNARSFQLLKDPMEWIDLPQEGSLFRRTSLHERQTEMGVLMSPAKPVLSLIISQHKQ